MAYVRLTDMRFSPNDKVEYAHKWGDMILDALKSLGITANCVKFSTNTNISSVYQANGIPEWVNTISSTSIYKGASSTQMRVYCNTCIWFIVDNIKYAIIIGNGAGGGDLGIDFCSTIYESTSTDISSNLTYRHTGGSKGTMGYTNKRDYMLIGYGDGGFHMTFRRDSLSTSYYMYAGHCRTSFNDSVFTPIFDLINQKPVHASMGNQLVVGSLAAAMATSINDAVGDVITKKYYAFDIFIGIYQGTIFGTLKNVFCIPYARGSYLGDVFTSGGENYMYLYTINNHKVFARV